MHVEDEPNCLDAIPSSHRFWTSSDRSDASGRRSDSTLSDFDAELTVDDEDRSSSRSTSRASERPRHDGTRAGCGWASLLRVPSNTAPATTAAKAAIRIAPVHADGSGS